MVSVGPLTFEGHYEKLPGTALFFDNVTPSTAGNEDPSSVKPATELVACCHRKIELKRVLLQPKQQNGDVAPESVNYTDEVSMEENLSTTEGHVQKQ